MRKEKAENKAQYYIFFLFAYYIWQDDKENYSQSQAGYSKKGRSHTLWRHRKPASLF
jgi:hypothetical protein